MSEYVDFHYMPLEGKITGKQVLKQTEDAINDIGEKVYSLDIDSSLIDEAIETSETAMNIAESALSAVTTGRSVWFNNVAEMVEFASEVGVVAETKGYYLVNDGGGAVYIIRQKTGGDVVDGGSIIQLAETDMVAQLVTDGSINVKQFGAIGNGVDDDSTAFQNTSTYAQTNGFTAFVALGTYNVTETITGTFNSFGEVTIIGGGTVDIVNLHDVVDDVTAIKEEVENDTTSAQASATSASTSATNAANSATSASTTLSQLIAYLDTKETLTAPAVDPTLTISGAAADAKVTGDKIKQIERAVAQAGNIVIDGYTQVNYIYINTSTTKFSVDSNHVGLNVLVFPIKSNTEYAISKETVSTMRVGTGTIANPVAGDSMTQTKQITTAGSITVTSGASDTYLYIQLWASADASAMKNNEVHLQSLVIQTTTQETFNENIEYKVDGIIDDGIGNYFDYAKYKNGDYTILNGKYISQAYDGVIQTQSSSSYRFSLIIVPVPANKNFVIYKKEPSHMRIGIRERGDLGVGDWVACVTENATTSSPIRISSFNNENNYLYIQLHFADDTNKDDDFLAKTLTILEDVPTTAASTNAKVGRYIDEDNRGLCMLSEVNAWWDNGIYRKYSVSSSNIDGKYKMVVVPIIGGKKYIVQKDTPTHMKIGSSPTATLNSGDSASVYVQSASASSNPLTIQTLEDDNYLIIQTFMSTDDIAYKNICINTRSLLVYEEKQEGGTSVEEINVKPLTEAFLQDINHRGYNTVAPENTLPAFKLSKTNGFNWIETDVRLTADNVFVCLHDATINRTARNIDGTTIGTSINIADITYAEALDYDFGIWKDVEYAGTKIPTLAETLALCRALNMKITIEIKNIGTQYNELANLVKMYGMTDKAEYIGSFTSIRNMSSIISNGNVGIVGSSGNCNSNLHGLLKGLRMNGNTVYYHTDIYNSDATRRAILDEIAADDFIVVSRTNSTSEALNAPQYSTIFMENQILASQIIYNNMMGE